MRKHSLLLATAFAVGPAYGMEDLSQFNPAMSVIVDGGYYHDDSGGDGPEIIEEHDSALHGHAGHDDEHDALQRGFNLGEAELTLSGSVDPYFDARLNAGLSEHGFELEEVWFSTRNLPAGLQLKGGKFLSAIGYHNEKHRHSWQFADQNLAYLSLIGDHGLAGTGLQLTWLAPTATYLQLGLEVLQGNDLEKFGARIDMQDVADDIAADFDPNGTGEFTPEELGLETDAGPQLGIGFVRLAPDLGTDHALQLGLSFAHHADVQGFHEETSDAFVSQGDADLLVAQAIFKRFAQGDYGRGSYALQAEYLQYQSDQRATFHTDPAAQGLALTQQQDAAYVQASYGFAPRWQIAARSAAAGLHGEVREGTENTRIDISRQHSLALSWYATEFSRLRLQFNRNDIATEDGREHFNQLLLQYNLSLGAHGAHAF